MSDKRAGAWVVYVRQWVTVYESRSVHDTVAAEECRGVAVNDYGDCQGRVSVERMEPGKAGKWVVRVSVPVAVQSASRKADAEKAAASLGGDVVKSGSPEEEKLVWEHISLTGKR